MEISTLLFIRKLYFSIQENLKKLTSNQQQQQKQQNSNYLGISRKVPVLGMTI